MHVRAAALEAGIGEEFVEAALAEMRARHAAAQVSLRRGGAISRWILGNQEEVVIAPAIPPVAWAWRIGAAISGGVSVLGRGFGHAIGVVVAGVLGQRPFRPPVRPARHPVAMTATPHQGSA